MNRVSRASASVLAALVAVSLRGAAAQQPARPPAGRTPPLPPLPMTQLDDREHGAELDNRIFTVSFVQPTPMRDVLMMLVRGTNLSIVPSPDVGGSFTGELKNVTVRRALDTVLPPFGLDYAVDGTVIGVFRRERETRLFDVNLLASSRTGTTTIGRAGGPDRSGAQVTTATSADVFEEIARAVPTLLSKDGTFSVDRKAGLLQVTDVAERLDRVGQYLDAVQDRVHRQVQIDARVLELEVDETPGPERVESARVPDLAKFLTDLAARGRVTTLAAPRLLTLNNEPAIIRGVDDGGRASAITLSVTPQVGDGVITLSISPIVSLRGTDSGTDREPAVEREADTLARVADGETLVVSGFARAREAREKKKSAVLTKKRVELLVLLTPKIVNPVGTQD